MFVLFHKIDLVRDKEAREEVAGLLKPFFAAENGMKVKYRATSIFDGSAISVMGEVLQEVLLKSTKARTITQALQDFISRNQELTGIAIYTENGLPVFEEGPDTDKILLPVNLWLTNYPRISNQFGTETYKTILETKDFVIVFQLLKGEFFLSGIGKKLAPLQYTLLKMEQLANIIISLL